MPATTLLQLTSEIKYFSFNDHEEMNASSRDLTARAFLAALLFQVLNLVKFPGYEPLPYLGKLSI